MSRMCVLQHACSILIIKKSKRRVYFQRIRPPKRQFWTSLLSIIDNPRQNSDFPRCHVTRHVSLLRQDQRDIYDYFYSKKAHKDMLDMSLRSCSKHCDPVRSTSIITKYSLRGQAADQKLVEHVDCIKEVPWITCSSPT